MGMNNLPVELYIFIATQFFFMLAMTIFATRWSKRQNEVEYLDRYFQEAKLGRYSSR